VTSTRRGLLAAGVGLLAAPGVAAVTDATAAADDGSEAIALAAAQRTQLLALACDEAVLAGPLLPAGTARTLVETLRDHARAHVAALRAAGARAGAPPSGAALERALAGQRIPGRPGHLRGERDALNLLLDVERVAIGAAYLALGTVHAPRTSTLLAQLMASGAQHEAALHEALHPGDIAGAVRYGIVQGTR
jgi:Ferritin-like domain